MNKCLTIVLLLLMKTGASQQLSFGIANKYQQISSSQNSFLGGNIGHRWNRFALHGYFYMGRGQKNEKFNEIGAGGRFYFWPSTAKVNMYVDAAGFGVLPNSVELPTAMNIEGHYVASFVRLNYFSYLHLGGSFSFEPVQIIVQSGLSSRTCTYRDGGEFQYTRRGWSFIVGANIYINYKKKPQ